MINYEIVVIKKFENFLSSSNTFSGTPGERGPFGPQGVQGFPGSPGSVGMGIL